MTNRILGMLSAACLLSSLTTPLDARPRATHGSLQLPASPARAYVIDSDRRLDVNRMSLVVSNVGSLGFDFEMLDAGLYYPAGSGKTLLFASGLWIGAYWGYYDIRVTVAEYSQEFVPGPMVGGGPGNPSAPANRVWKVKRWTGDAQDTAHVERAPGDRSVDVLVHHAWSEYLAGAAPSGAPWKIHRLPDTSTSDPSDSVDVPGPDVMGDLMTWCLFNDADAAAHTNDAGGTAPLGAEVEQIVFGFDDPGPLGDVAFVRWRVRNRGTLTWPNFLAGFWADPDIGGAAGYADDKVGCDSVRTVGFAYNGDAVDGGYGSNPPVLGIDVLAPVPNAGSGRQVGMHAFRGFVNGTDPAATIESYSAMSGRMTNGDPIVDPLWSETRYEYSGDPALGTGWIDPSVWDKRMMVGLAPRTVVPGDSLEIWATLVVAPEPGVPAALRGLACRTEYTQAVFASGFARPFPAAPECSVPPNCPRSVDYWLDQCAGGGSIAHLVGVMGMVDAGSVVLDFAPNGLANWCAMLAQDADSRQRAYAEFSAFLANARLSSTSLQPVGEQPVALWPLTPVTCPGLAGTTVGELATTASMERIVTGTYQNLVTTHRQALTGVNWGLPSFNGGAGSGWDFFGGTLNPSTMPDSFPRAVRITFDRTQSQRAYRYLRYQQADGTNPNVGRVYAYAGYVDVPFTVRDSASGDQLETAFVEKVVTDYAGTIQPAAFQPATFDSTWEPTDDALGDREYLFIIRRPYAGAPRAEFALDGAIMNNVMPLLFALSARLRTATDVIDDGDAFDFRFDYAYTPGVDAILRELAGQSLSDPAVAAQYQQIADCLGAINRGETVGPACDEPTPALVSLASAQAEPGLVRVEWLVAAAGSVTVERREGEGAWQDFVTAAPDGNGRIAIEDRDVQAGLSYSYRLRLASDYAGEVTLDVPSQHRLSLAGFRPNPAIGPLSVAFTLGSSAPARLEVLDVAGRRVFARAIERPVAGQRVLPLADVRLAPGVYVLRLEQGSERLVARGVVLR